MTVKFFPLFFKEDYGLNPGYLDLCRNSWNSYPKNMFDVSVQHSMLFQLICQCAFLGISHFGVMEEMSIGGRVSFLHELLWDFVEKARPWSKKTF